MRGFLVLVALSSAACLRTTEFHCTTNAECGASGVCVPDGLCSVTDMGCTSGLRYSDTAGSRANDCVGGGGAVDARVDGPGVDAAIDAQISGCPGQYNTIVGGQGTHRYRLLTASDDWAMQRSFCAATSSSAYLAIPDDLTELQAIATLGAAARFWVGISDLATEGVYVTVRTTAQTFLPWETGAPDDGPPSEDCVEVVSATSKINDQRCNTQYVAVCECEP
ncbi:MAG: lectin-like protein [Polyangiales bacterium]